MTNAFPVLPIDSVLPDVCSALERGTNAVLQAPPGAGKTTKVPLALLDAKWRGDQKIIMLEPRRLAARAAARRMAHLLGENVGDRVGYRVRFDSKVTAKTKIEVVTEGILVRMIQDDPELSGVGALIFDEFHERSLDADLGLALALETQGALRDDLRIIVMSATLDGDPIARLMGDCPVISSEGRAYPVETTYIAPRVDNWGNIRIDAEMTAAIRTALREETGSILAFLPGQGEITRVEAALKQSVGKDVIVAPLYGAMNAQAQDIAIEPAADGMRKVVLATSIAETSLTIDGIRVVIDSGLQRLPQFDPASGMTRLVTVKSSQASAEQRRGRAGRLEPGMCYRLWAEAEHRARPAFTNPEISVADLAPLTLELARWGVTDPNSLPWLDVPDGAKLDQARDVLRRLEALDEAKRITAMGTAMAGLPVHPRLAHMMLRGDMLGLADQACALAALLSDRDFMRGRGADLRLRVEAILNRQAPKMIGEAAKQLARRLKEARHKVDLTGDKDRVDRADQVGLLLAFAYPDRIGERRKGQDARYRLSGGRGGVLPNGDSLAAEPYIAVAELDGQAREAKIYLAAPLSRATLETHFADQISEGTEVFWEAQSSAVQARWQRRIGALVLDEKATHDAADPEAITTAMIEGIRRLGLHCLAWDKAADGLRERLAFLHRVDGESWPDVSDEGLLASLETWLAPYLTGITKRNQLKQINISEALLSGIDWQQRQELDRLAPTHWQVPTGSNIRLDYSGDTPALPVRMQEMFGATETPMVGGGKVAVTLHLLSPAQRPIQVTSDLIGFWNGSYAQVKAEMKGRYPKHYWPDDPQQAEPTRRVKSKM
ncbi:ATP-dependent helicase HrpB [Thalassospira sp. GB04J01]|uniref:ATP-dependent helicase HrpB n=1 Tax=Thalassospira sp. GB04J01 TaxID=1485225 RepID=UPI000C9C09EB|nr:ATP-dependent helicase HrpB [Thalassospira sp. GB04J01]|tara:strand:- start:76081 stop:78585 length:2505 start_codon:yes stop_codon:yes gene_type:complete